MSKSYSHFDLEHGQHVSIYSENQARNLRKGSERMRPNKPRISGQLAKPAVLQNYSLYQPSELQEKLHKFEQIKRNRFKKGLKAQTSAVIEESAPVPRKRRTETETRGEFGKYYSNREVGNPGKVSSVKDSVKRRFELVTGDSKRVLEELRKKEIFEMNAKEMKIIFSVLDYKNLGYINKDNFDLNVLPSHLIKKMKGLIINVISSDKAVDFEEFLQLIYT